jgi:hypothetical protein
LANEKILWLKYAQENLIVSIFKKSPKGQDDALEKSLCCTATFIKTSLYSLPRCSRASVGTTLGPAMASPWKVNQSGRTFSGRLW